MVFKRTPSALDGCTLGAFVGALVREVEGFSPSPSRIVATLHGEILELMNP
jgi:hypothetical protein